MKKTTVDYNLFFRRHWPPLTVGLRKHLAKHVRLKTYVILYMCCTCTDHGLENYWIGHRGEGPSHAGQLRTVCILS